MAKLSRQQRDAVELDGDVFVTACPGSGKTRVLTEKLISTLEAGLSPHQRVAAVTFTNRAADEIATRVQDRGFSRKQLWTGTIHSFALEWVLRPYASYDEQLRKGFSVADDGFSRKLLDSLREKHGVNRRTDVRLGIKRDGTPIETRQNERSLVQEYRCELAAKRLIDFEEVLYLAYSLLQSKEEISRTLGAIFALFCIDEYQDTQDLQFGILSSITLGSNGRTRLFIVGDTNQAIYASLGGLAKTVHEVREEFGRPEMRHRELSGNYRSTQRIVDFSAELCDSGNEPVQALSEHSAEIGLITFFNQTFDSTALAEKVAEFVRYHLQAGIRPEDICILGPSWWMLTDFGRQLILHLPDVDIDAPGLSPLRYQPDSLWFKLARLFLTEPGPARYRARHRWATDLVSSIEASLQRELREEVRSPRAVLRLLNAISSEEESGLAYLDDCFEQLFEALEIDLREHPEMLELRQSFFDSAEERLIERNIELESVDTLRRMFRYPSGVVVNSCHGAKGEEYSVVICFGLLRGYIPHWTRIMDEECDEVQESRRILYVIASRAKKYLHLFAESGRFTQSGRPYETTRELVQVAWQYDDFLLSIDS